MAHGPDTEELLRRMAKDTKMLSAVRLNITSLPELPSELEYLFCSYTQLSSLPKLPSGLEYLHCQNTLLTSLPELPSSLVYLNCKNTYLTSLPDLPSGLQTLICSDTQLSSLPDLPSDLRFLRGSNTQLSSLSEIPFSLQWLECSDTPFILRRKENESISDYNQRWKAWREEEVSRKRIQAKHRLLKEEIVMESWHPRKVERWVELGADLADL